jgi:hypothetical protein
MKAPFGFGCLALALAATANSAKAECVTGAFRTNLIVCSLHEGDIEQPKQNHETESRPANLHHHVAKRREPQQGDEKAHPAIPPPALPRQ